MDLMDGGGRHTQIRSDCSDSSRHTLVINALGPLVIEVGGVRLRKAPKKVLALLAYLAMQEGAPVTRIKLADMLWPDQQSERARHSLRNCLLKLRKGLGPAVIHLVTDVYHCRLLGAVTDLERLAQLARSPQTSDLRAAAELYRGEVLDGLVIASEPFEEWLASEREGALTCVCEVLRKLTTLDIDGDFGPAIDAGRRLVRLDPLCERGHRAMMRAYAAAGQRGNAIRQYRSCREILARELGVSADRETTKLAGELGVSAVKPDDEELMAKLGRLEKGIRAGLAGKRPFTRSLMAATAEALFRARIAFDVAIYASVGEENDL